MESYATWSLVSSFRHRVCSGGHPHCKFHLFLGWKITLCTWAAYPHDSDATRWSAWLFSVMLPCPSVYKPYYLGTCVQLVGTQVGVELLGHMIMLRLPWQELASCAEHAPSSGGSSPSPRPTQQHLLPFISPAVAAPSTVPVPPHGQCCLSSDVLIGYFCLFFGDMSPQILCPFSSWALILSSQSSSYILGTMPLSDMWLSNIFFHSEDFPSTFLMVFLDAQGLTNHDDPSTSPSAACTFIVTSMRLSLNPTV